MRQPADEQLDLYRAAVDATYGSPFHAMTEPEARDWDELIPLGNRSVIVEQSPPSPPDPARPAGSRC